ncbi:hypothetical protein Tco_0509318 [Tanacetum coccineum]
MKPWKNYCFHKFPMSFFYEKDVAKMQSLGCMKLDQMKRYLLRWLGLGLLISSKKIIKFRLGGSAHNLTSLEFARRLGLYQAVELEEEVFNVYFEGGLRNDDNFNAHEYWTNGYDKIQKNDLWLLSMFDARHQNGVLTKDVVRSLSAPIYCRDLDTITLRDLINSGGRLIPEDPQSGVPNVGIPKPSRASMPDLYDRMSRMKIRQEAIERMEYREPTTHLVMLNYSMTSTISSTHLRHHSISSSSRMMSSVEMARVGLVTACFGSLMF